MTPLRIAFCVGLIILATSINAYALSASGTSGSIDFDGKGTITHMQVPFLVNEVFGNSNCVSGLNGLIMTVCHPALDTSLRGSDIIRAEFVRIGGSAFPSVNFGCAGCGSIHVGPFDLVGSALSAAKTAELQSLIDQNGVDAVHISISIGNFNGSNTTIQVGSIARAVNIDLKSDGQPNKLNPRSRGVTPLAILSTAFFDATTIDVTSLRFGATGHEVAPRNVSLEDVDGDGRLDLVVLFNTQQTDIDCDTLFVFITGATADGQLVAGIDGVTTAGCH